jgi:hypothetical protein
MSRTNAISVSHYLRKSTYIRGDPKHKPKVPAENRTGFMTPLSWVAGAISDPGHQPTGSRAIRSGHGTCSLDGDARFDRRAERRRSSAPLAPPGGAFGDPARRPCRLRTRLRPARL